MPRLGPVVALATTIAAALAGGLACHRVELRGEGARCAATDDCAPGLSCTGRVCVRGAAGDGGPDAPCGRLDDPRNCGVCGHDCYKLANVRQDVSTLVCDQGRCVIPPEACVPGFAHCTENPDDGCESSLSRSENCGRCGRQCGGDTPSCVSQPGGWTCGHGCEAPGNLRCDGVCVDTTRDRRHCGGCHASCSLANATGQCVEGSCRAIERCNDGYDDCNGVAGDGCETRLGTELDCARCRDRCEKTGAMNRCEAGRCQFTCNAGFKESGGSCVACTESVAALCGRGQDGLRCALADPRTGLLKPDKLMTPHFDDRQWSETAEQWGSIQFVNLDLDDRLDYCARAPTGILCAYGDKDGFADRGPSYNALRSDEGWSDSRARWNSIKFADFDGDGRADIGAQIVGETLLLTGTDTSFSSYTQGFTVISGVAPLESAPSYWATQQYPDLDGDGADEMCVRTSAGIHCGKYQYLKYVPTTLWDTEGFFSDAHGFAQSSRWETIQYPDLDGDNRADVCGRGSDGVYCSLSKKTDRFDFVTRWTHEFADDGATAWASDSSYWATIQFPDVDGDGKQDVCGRAKDGLRCGLSTGSSFSPSTLWAAGFSDAEGWNQHRYAATIQFEDLNGDGADDVCGRRQGGVACALSTRAKFDRWNAALAFTGEGWERQSQWATLDFRLLVRGNCRPIKRRTRDRRIAVRIPF